MVRVNDGQPVHDLPMIIPEARVPPAQTDPYGQPYDPNAEMPQAGADGVQDGTTQGLDEALGGQPQGGQRQTRDPVEAILEELLGGGN